ncbi:hypothetical protein LSH36_63g11010 [Paralvinella palmiformis]|uniref:Uncharacterized protein n=1 Tax=Paralvinella palmiformis TaxID=53620 RepID=A0AAD9K4C7_9ANNE|nr:hypothetical protein LSH36_63g11010 [Paralvinella palmiformis]
MCKDRCKRQEFRIMSGSSVNREVLVYDGPWTWKICRRLCRQYLECLAFKMTWSTTSHDFGMCTIYKAFFKQSDLIVTPECTMYISCPRNLVLDISRDVCHSPVLLGPSYYFEALKVCREIYNFKGTAHTSIMAARNINDTNFLNLYAGKLWQKDNAKC